MADKKESKVKKIKKVKPAKEVSGKKTSKLAIRNKIVEVLLTLDPAMKEKKILKRAKKATKIIGKGIRKKGTTVLIAEVLEIKEG